MALDNPVTIAEFEPRMMAPLLELMATHFKPGDSILAPAVHEWLYLNNPFGVAKAVWVSGDEGWSGFLAMVPVVLARHSDRHKAWFVVNVLVDPRQRGKNLFLKMIDAAVERAKAEDVALMGHPNAAALPFWRRKRMQFHEDLRPALALPAIPGTGAKARRVTSIDMLQDLADLSETIPGAFDQWKVAADLKFLEWRYLRHPARRYDLQRLEFRGGEPGLQISRRAKYGARLLIDQFASRANLGQAFGALPVPTICFLAPSAIPDAGRAIVPLPWKRRLPVFLTDYLRTVDSSEVAHLGLSSSDL